VGSSGRAGTRRNYHRRRYVFSPAHVHRIVVSSAFMDRLAAPIRVVRPLDADRREWNDLIARHDRSVMVALLARGIRADRARDLAQAAWTKLWERRREGGLERLELPGLAIRQALFIAADEARSRRNAPPVDLTVHPSLTDSFISRESLSRVQGELQRCPESMRRVFVLVHGGEGLSHTEVAERTGLSLQRVRQLMCEARQRLRAVLEVDR
jgi:RNA polymerase sigma factor (sigma-70 family)